MPLFSVWQGVSFGFLAVDYSSPAGTPLSPRDVLDPTLEPMHESVSPSPHLATKDTVVSGANVTTIVTQPAPPLTSEGTSVEDAIAPPPSIMMTGENIVVQPLSPHQAQEVVTRGSIPDVMPIEAANAVVGPRPGSMVIDGRLIDGCRVRTVVEEVVRVLDIPMVEGPHGPFENLIATSMAVRQFYDWVCHQLSGEITVLKEAAMKTKAQLEKMVGVAAQVSELASKNDRLAATLAKCEANLVEELTAKDLALSSLQSKFCALHSIVVASCVLLIVPGVLVAEDKLKIARKNNGEMLQRHAQEKTTMEERHPKEVTEQASALSSSESAWKDLEVALVAAKEAKKELETTLAAAEETKNSTATTLAAAEGEKQQLKVEMESVARRARQREDASASSTASRAIAVLVQLKATALM